MRGLEQIPWLYDALAALTERTEVGRSRRWLTAGARGRTLDVGTGTGRNLPRFPAGTFVVAVDPCLGVLHRARRRAPQASVVVARVEALPFHGGAFDTVASSLVFCSVADPARGLAEIRRVLAPSGQLRMLEHVRSTVRWRARCQDVLQPVWTRLTGGCHPNRDTERTVEVAGFQLAADGRRAFGSLRRFAARPDGDRSITC
jgi:ubiquinone/menaquinone biosynthesis C-methylase UbiE